MAQLEFGVWLTKQGYGRSTVNQMLNRLDRLREGYGDLEAQHRVDGLTTVQQGLRYSTADARRGLSNPTPLRICGDLRTGLSTYASTLRAYSVFLDSQGGEFASKPKRGRLERDIRHSSDALLRDTGNDAASVILDAAAALSFEPAHLVAACSRWVPAESIHLLRLHSALTWYPGYRLARAGESLRRSYQGLNVDDGTRAETAIKLAVLGRSGASGFSACHLWAESEYDGELYTNVCNLALLPTPIASLVRTIPHLRATLRYRSWCLYGWHPEGSTVPTAPKDYPSEAHWRKDRPEPRAQDVVAQRVADQLQLTWRGNDWSGETDHPL